jgi:pimeloyl-ACP methyl ester carboxylesterase
MIIKPISHIIAVNNIQLHVIDYQNKKPLLLMLHGLTANAYAFNGLVQAGLTNDWHVISIDMRGRGLSTKPAFNYSIRDHAKDVIALLDNLEIEKIAICGHSFGGLVGTYLAYKYPTRISKLIILDAAPKMNPKAGPMLLPAISRIDKHFKNFEEYLSVIKKAEYMTFWDEAMLPYYIADVRTDADGSVECVSNLADIMQISVHVGMEPWKIYFEGMAQQCLLIVGTGEYTMGEPLMPDYLAKDTVKRMKYGRYAEVEGNHQTMLFGVGAQQIVALMRDM